MDEYTGKRAAGKLGFSRRGSNLSFREPNQEDRSIQYCSRLGCSNNRLNSMKTTQAGYQEKFKYSKASFHPTSSKASSSRSFSSPSDFRKSHQERQNQISLRKNAIVESSSRQGETEDLRFCNRQELIEDSDTSSRQEETDDSESGLVTPGVQTVLPDSGDLESTILQYFPSSTTEALGGCTLASSSRSRKQINRQLGTSKQESSGSSVRRSFVSRSTTLTVKPVSQGLSAGPQRYGLKNLGCTSISDVLPARCSSSDSGHNTRVYSIRKRSCDGEGSSTGVRAMSESSSGGYSDSSNIGLSSLHPEHSLSQQTSRRARNQPTSRDGTVSARTRRPPSGESRMRFPEQEDGNIVSPSETIVVPRLSQTQFSIPEALPERSSRSFPSERPPVLRGTFGRSGSSGRSARTRSSSRLEGSSTQVIHGPLGDRESYRRFNMEGIAEVLLALERIEQDEELTYEQLLVLETNLFLGGLSFHDQHRDMRMDIDNMSYEELLALEEKMGTVSTALSEEALTKCLKKSIYAPGSMFPGVSSCGDDDIKCIICQEEYDLGDEVGKLACEHRYHATCIDQWLRQKNWCPICKAPACPS